ncbi:hypothetical protein SCUCBS95973_002395 [Sporothrix curviconia]|uniref:Zn(2)-C6 fungal-type domain-containing protein n=1 Tax=Sporothrix curviconia TaxID=1260050 RepID=A0ABP0B6J8_9PEZI
MPVEKQHRRSRAGCHRCRQQHKRCDQRKPSCARCQTAGSACSYELTIKWGGRAFPRMLGSYAGRVQRLSNGGGGMGEGDGGAAEGTGGFVYIAQPPLPASPQPRARRKTPQAESERHQEQETASMTSPDFLADAAVAEEEEEEETVGTSSDSITTVSHVSPAKPFLTQLDPFASPMHRFLFHHYLQETIRLTAPSDYARNEICRLVVPLSFHHPCLLYAVLAFAARHVHSLGGFPMPDNGGQRLIMELEDESMRHLRHQLAEEAHLQQNAAVALATTRTLCQSQIFATGHAWRTHLEGAKAILQSIGMSDNLATSASSSSSSSNLHIFLASWYDNVEAQAALTPLGLRRGQLEMASSKGRTSNIPGPSTSTSTSPRFHHENGQDVYFDVFGGVASDVPDLFREVGALVMERRRSLKRRVYDEEEDNSDNDDDDDDDDDDEEEESASILSEDDIAREADALVRAIHVRLERDAVANTLRRLRDDDRVAGSLPADAMHDYALSNAGFLHTALLYIHGAVQGLPPSAPPVRHSVAQILWASDNMRSASAPLSPRVLMATPLFAAGLWALPDAQVAVQQSFAAMGTWMRTPHNRRSAALLAHVWGKTAARPDEYHDVLTYLGEL